LSERYLVLQTSFASGGDFFASEQNMAQMFSNRLSRMIRERDPGYAGIADMLGTPMPPGDPFEILGTRISALCQQVGKPVLLMIDEVDHASDYDVFASFLLELRTLYLRRKSKGWDSTFHSVILAGVHDIKYLKAKIRNESEHTWNSPWNIAARFKVDMSFSRAGIASMLDEYEQDHITGMDTGEIADRIYQYTEGYPFLVSLMCKLMDEKGLPWSEAGVDEAARLALKDESHLFVNMIKNLQIYPDLREIVELIILEGALMSADDPRVELGIMYGILKADRHNSVRVANAIISTRLMNHFVSI
jgi:hypothetical protein